MKLRNLSLVPDYKMFGTCRYKLDKIVQILLVR